jgi:hypothetical protein
MSLDEIRAIAEVAIKAQRNEVYNATQLCAKLGIAANTLRTRIVRGEIPPKQKGGWSYIQLARHGVAGFEV